MEATYKVRPGLGSVHAYVVVFPCKTGNRPPLKKVLDTSLPMILKLFLSTIFSPSHQTSSN
jgi:hypothetical protein